MAAALPTQPPLQVSIPLQGLVASGPAGRGLSVQGPTSFNPSPGISGFRTIPQHGVRARLVCFNPSPGISGFRTRNRPPDPLRLLLSFNPSPGISGFRTKSLQNLG